MKFVLSGNLLRFSSFGRDTYPQRVRISDHPIVQTRAHLQN